jgi:hypothetical protein
LTIGMAMLLARALVHVIGAGSRSAAPHPPTPTSKSERDRKVKAEQGGTAQEGETEQEGRGTGPEEREKNGAHRYCRQSEAVRRQPRESLHKRAMALLSAPRREAAGARKTPSRDGVRARSSGGRALDF